MHYNNVNKGKPQGYWKREKNMILEEQLRIMKRQECEITPEEATKYFKAKKPEEKIISIVRAEGNFGYHYFVFNGNYRVGMIRQKHVNCSYRFQPRISGRKMDKWDLENLGREKKEEIL